MGGLVCRCWVYCSSRQQNVAVVHVKTCTMRSPVIGEVQPWPVPAASDGCCARRYWSRAPALLLPSGGWRLLVQVCVRLMRPSMGKQRHKFRKDESQDRQGRFSAFSS